MVETETVITEPKKNSTQSVADSIATAKLAARAAAESKGQDIVLIDISKQTSIFDCFLIVTGTSRRQLQAIAEEIHRLMKERGESRLSMSGYDESRWIAVDYGCVKRYQCSSESSESARLRRSVPSWEFQLNIFFGFFPFWLLLR